MRAQETEGIEERRGSAATLSLRPIMALFPPSFFTHLFLAASFTISDWPRTACTTQMIYH